jgi:hypothetical protein
MLNVKNSQIKAEKAFFFLKRKFTQSYNKTKSVRLWTLFVRFSTRN